MPYARTKVSQKIPPLKDLKNVTFHLWAVHCEATADQYSEKVLSTKTQRELIGRWVVELNLQINQAVPTSNFKENTGKKGINVIQCWYNDFCSPGKNF